ncbi:hypothetical protein LCGC14_1863410 [marine sediment metagenome]|uniref:Uncharacterized protein n=1 Tax=marine sediment metagenome TaxID=412755 RepID=A0A0F9G6U9_9ZZZZ
MGDVRIDIDIHIDKEIEYILRRSGVIPTDVLSIDNTKLYFGPGALHKLQAAIDVYLDGPGGAHKEAKNV